MSTKSELEQKIKKYEMLIKRAKIEIAKIKIKKKKVFVVLVEVDQFYESTDTSYIVGIKIKKLKIDEDDDEGQLELSEEAFNKIKESNYDLFAAEINNFGEDLQYDEFKVFTKSEFISIMERLIN